MTLALAARAAPPEVAPIEQAVTVAFAERDGAREAFLVVAAGEEHLTAVPLGGGDAFAALAALSDAQVAALLRDAPRSELALADLLPALEGAQHVAGGANYVEHAEEADAPAPFLFPKRAEPTPWDAPVATQPDWLLDYEVEIAVVFDRDIARAADLAGARAGVLLVNDFTERAQLTFEADLSERGVGAGFANAKGKPGFLPTGPFLVIPRDWRGFVRDCEIRLHVNGAERQRARGGEMTWSVDELARRTLALGSKARFVHEGQAIALTPGTIPRGTAILTGTPAGVVYRAPRTGFIATNAAWWALSFAFLDSDAPTFVKRRWVQQLHEGGAFLRAGDVVIAEGSGLGRIVTPIVTPDAAP
jgi:2-keto-4-pentenoate hydratase/2-oxohepta-3-ene-1,7-dioic acid hydratase in catechol pathway